MDETSYRSLLERVSASAGKSVCSAKDLTPAQLTAVLDEFKRLGALRPSAKTKDKPRNFKQLPEMITKVEALLADMRLPWSYADAIAKQQFRIARVAWCRSEDQLRAIIAALDVEQEKRDLLAEVEATCVRLELTLEQLEEQYRLGSKRWRRNREALKSMRDALARDFPQAEVQ